MRAVYLPHIFSLRRGETLILDHKKDLKVFHHLINVVRLNKDDQVLGLNGQGLVFPCSVMSITKTSITLNVLDVSQKAFFDYIHLALSVPKKEAFESSLKMATEGGIRKIIPFESEYSNAHALNSIESSYERFNGIIEGALVQSNNFFKPTLNSLMSFDQLVENFKNYQNVFYFSSQNLPSKGNVQEIKFPCLFIIGPEGGFSEKEEKRLSQVEILTRIHLKIPILRTPTAVALATGFILGQTGLFK